MSSRIHARENEALTLHQRIDRSRHWLYEVALPFWGSVGVDPGFGFVEHLDGNARPAAVPYKRLRVQARQVYVFSHAYVTGYSAGLDCAQHGWEFMCKHGRRLDGGWVRQMGRRGGVLDSTLDLYDQAFALLAAAWWARASGDQTALAAADETLEAIDRRLAAPDRLGWWSEDGPAAALLQNPHMHMLEALAALDEAADDMRYRARMHDVLDIFEHALFDPVTGTVAEYFDPAWKRLPGPEGVAVMPGHHYEWVWLLHRTDSRVGGGRRWAQALLEFAERAGRDAESGLVYDEVLEDGRVARRSFRTWANSEPLKAHLARFEREGTADARRLDELLDNLWSRFLRGPVEGTWMDRLDERLAPAATTIPASTLYHLFAAISELLRLEPDLGAADYLA
jgi:mannose/cellobiose epimerase-like protein (N-acyl-D-glucosamine 2-epimerase family)